MNMKNRIALACSLTILLSVFACSPWRMGTMKDVSFQEETTALPPQGTGILPAPNLIQASPLEV